MRYLWATILFLGAGIVAFFSISSILWQHRAIAGFVPVHAHILSARLGVHHNKNTTYTPEVSYTYTSNHRQFTSSRVLPFSENGSRGWAQDILSHFPPGQAATAYVDPADPAQAILWRQYSSTPYLFATFSALASLGGLFALAGIIAGGRKSMLAIPIDAEGRHLLMPVNELRKQCRNWLLILLGYTLVMVLIWGHFMAVAREFDTGVCFILLAGLAVWIFLLLMAARAHSMARHVSDARVIASPIPMKRGEPFQLRVELDTYQPLQLNALTAAIVCIEHYREKRGSKINVGTRTFLDQSIQLCGPSTLKADDVIAGEGQITIADTAPPTFASRATYPYYTWEIRVKAALAGATGYKGAFPLETA